MHFSILIVSILDGDFFFSKDDETVEQVSQKGDRCHIPGNIQGQMRQGSEQPGWVEDVSAHGRGLVLGDSERSLPAQTILWLYTESL